MDERLLEILVDPRTKKPLRLRENGTGAVLESDDGNSYLIRNGIPRFVGDLEAGQAQTGESFGFKWQWRGFSDSPRLKEQFGEWVAQRYGFSDLDQMRSFFESRERILDAGCGAGYSSSMWLDDSWRGGEWVGADVSEAVDVAQARLGSVPGTSFVQADVLELPFESVFDTVFSEGVFHHTPSTRAALASAVDALQPGGEILFYVYRRKSPIREFTDDYVRQSIADLEPAAEAHHLLRDRNVVRARHQRSPRTDHEERAVDAALERALRSGQRIPNRLPFRHVRRVARVEYPDPATQWLRNVLQCRRQQSRVSPRERVAGERRVAFPRLQVHGLVAQ